MGPDYETLRDTIDSSTTIKTDEIASEIIAKHAGRRAPTKAKLNFRKDRPGEDTNPEEITESLRVQKALQFLSERNIDDIASPDHTPINSPRGQIRKFRDIQNV